MSYRIAWRVDGALDGAVTLATVRAGALRDASGREARRGSRVACEVRVLGLSDGSFAVYWEILGTDGSGRGLYGAHFAADGSPLGAPARAHTATAGDQRLGDLGRFADDRYVLVFDDQYGDASGYGIRARIFGPTGAPLTAVLNVNSRSAGQQQSPAVTVLDTGDWVAAWSDDQQRVWARRFLPTGKPAPARVEWRLNTTTAGAQKAVAAARRGATTLAAFESQAAVVSRTLVLQGANPVLGPEVQLSAPTAVPHAAPAVGAGGSRFAVAWHAVGSQGEGQGVYVRFLDGGGQPVGDEVTVHDGALPAGHAAPAVAVHADDRAVVAWTVGSAAGGQGDIYVRGVRSNGLYDSSPARVNAYTDQIQDRAAVALGPDDRAVVGWQSNGQDGSGWGVYLRRLDVDHVPLGPEVRASTTTNHNQRDLALAIAPTGDRLTVCWVSFDQDASGSYGVYCQMFVYSTLAKVGAELRAAGIVQGHQRNPAVATLATGEAVVAWDSEQVDTDRYAVQYRRLTPQGVFDGPRTVMNRTWAGSQEFPALVPLAGSGLVALWESTDLDGSDRGVYFRALSAP